MILSCSTFGEWPNLIIVDLETRSQNLVNLLLKNEAHVSAPFRVFRQFGG